MATANRCWDIHFFFSGEIVEGNKLGEIGYPTANLVMEKNQNGFRATA